MEKCNLRKNYYLCFIFFEILAFANALVRQFGLHKLHALNFVLDGVLDAGVT
jgi:hypothetical protein